MTDKRTSRPRTYESELTDALPSWTERNARPTRRRSGLRQWLERNGFTAMWNTTMAGTDLAVVLVVVILVALGLLMVYSAAIGENIRFVWGLSLSKWFDGQLKWAGLGLAAMILLWRIRYAFWRRWTVLMMSMVVILLIVVVVLNFARFGAARSLFRNGSVQPAEFAKLVIVIYLAHWLSSLGPKIKQLGFGLLPFAALVGSVTGLIMMHKLSTGLLVVATAVAMFYVAGADGKQLGISALAVGAFSGLSIGLVGYARRRLEAFVAAWVDPAQAVGIPEADQMRVFVQALRGGGLFGNGLGKGTVRGAVAHTDGIFAVIGNELGLIGALAVIALFVALAYRGILISRRAPNSFGVLLAFGITFWLASQAFVNVAVVTATIPTTGVPLPFISYGGTALVTALAGIGILLSVSCSSEEDEEADAHAGVRRGDGGTRLPRAGGH